MALTARIFDYSDYKKYLQDWLDALPRHGHGQMRRIAEHLNIHTTLVSQIFGGPKDLTLEQAMALCSFLSLGELESDYFVGLVELQRAGTTSLKALAERRLQRLRVLAEDLVNRLPRDRVLSEAEKATFYSNWYYNGIWLLVMVPGFETPEAIADYFKLPLPLVQQVVGFLCDTGLLIKEGCRLTMGARYTHLETASPLIAGHHRIWRTMAMGRFDTLRKEELAFSAPLTLAREDFPKVRAEIVAFIERIWELVRSSPSEKLACLNIDWFDL